MLASERALRLLRAKCAELEAKVLHEVAETGEVRDTVLIADIALIAQLLADHIEESIF